MKTFRIPATFAFAALFLSVFAASARAEEGPKKLMAVLALSSMDDLTKTAEQFGAATDNPALGPMLTMAITMGTQGKGLGGIDKSAPIALAVFADDRQSNPRFVIYVPAKSAKDVYGILPKPQGKAAGKATEKDGVLSGPAFNGRPFYLTKKGKWVLVTDGKYLLDVAPEDITESMGDLPKKYLLGLRVLLKDLTQGERESVVAGAKVVLQDIPGGGTPFAAVAANVQGALADLTSKLESLDDFSLGVQFDETEKKLVAEAVVVVKDGSKLASNLSELRSLKTDYAGFLSGDFSAGATRTAIVDEMKAGSKFNPILENAKNSNMPPETKTAFIDGFAFMDELNEQAHSGGRINDGFAVKCETKNISILYGAKIKDADKLEATFKKAATSCRKGVPMIVTDVALDGETIKGLKAYKISLNIPKTNDGIELFAEKAELVAAFGEGKAFLCLSEKATDFLTNYLDSASSAEGNAAPLLKIQIKLAPIAKTLQESSPSPISAALNEALEKASGKDVVSLSGVATGNNEFAVRLEIEEGVLKAAGAATQAMAQGGLGSPNAPSLSAPPSDGKEHSPFAE